MTRWFPRRLTVTPGPRRYALEWSVQVLSHGRWGRARFPGPLAKRCEGGLLVPRPPTRLSQATRRVSGELSRKAAGDRRVGRSGLEEGVLHHAPVPGDLLRDLQGWGDKLFGCCQCRPLKPVRAATTARVLGRQGRRWRRCGGPGSSETGCRAYPSSVAVDADRGLSGRGCLYGGRLDRGSTGIWAGASC